MQLHSNTNNENDEQNNLTAPNSGNYSQNLIDSFENGGCGYTKFF